MPTKTFAGKTVEVDNEGFLIHHTDWSEEMAPEIAKEEGIQLTEAHWKVLRFIRKDFQETGQIPTIRRIKNAGGIPTNELYELFPQGPAKKSAKIAGFGKPQGCV
ncbi:MAG: sulfur relay protein DsrC [Bacteroidetes bacterium RBG_13_42_15]|nr:MAG: sulfur relay protein DsrC [Bacteroidetes bacterium RBG_13_42_15]